MLPENVSETPLTAMSPRLPDSHKGDYGKVIVMGGSPGMAGAISITGLSALRSGAGLVTVATPQSVSFTVANFSPCYMTLPLVADGAGVADLANIVELEASLDKFDAWAIGPGIGRSDGVTELVAGLYQHIPAPVVVDADGLFALAAGLARNPGLLSHSPGARILTPHDGEFSRLIDAPVASEVALRAQQASEFCRRDERGETIIVLKGHRTIIADAGRYAVNSTGNPGMATAGSGDCLTGVITALLCQGLEPWEAARLGVHVHGLAGDLAAEQLGQTSLIATDLVDFLPHAFQQLCS